MAAVQKDQSSADAEASPPPLVIELATLAATQRLGQRLGAVLQPGDVLGLDGPLGAGKTSLVQGLARGLGVPRSVAVGSPTFTLVNQYDGQLAAAPGAEARPIVLYHVDLYRLNSAAELDELGLWEAAESGGVMAVEWLSRYPEALPADRLELTLDILPSQKRALKLQACGPRSARRLIDLQKASRPARQKKTP